MKNVKALSRAMSLFYQKNRQNLQNTIVNFRSLSPLKIMERGYSLAYNESGELVKSANKLT